MSKPKNTKQELELQLLRNMQLQHAIYEQANPIADELVETFDLSPTSQQRMQEFESLMQNAVEAEKIGAELRNCWKKEFGKLSDELQAENNRLMKLIKRLIESTDKIEKRAVRCKNSLAPQMSEQLQIQKAASAYSIK